MSWRKSTQNDCLFFHFRELQPFLDACMLIVFGLLLSAARREDTLMKFKSKINSLGEKLAERTARRNGHGGIISIPGECIGRRYVRYYDRETGIITLVPDEIQTAEPREEA